MKHTLTGIRLMTHVSNVAAALLMMISPVGMHAQSRSWEIPLPALDSATVQLTVELGGKMNFIAHRGSEMLFLSTTSTAVKTWLDGTDRKLASGRTVTGFEVLSDEGPSLGDTFQGTTISWARYTRASGVGYRLFVSNAVNIRDIRFAGGNATPAQYSEFTAMLRKAVALADSVRGQY